MNLLLLTILVSEICLGICVWCSPQLLRWVGAYLLTRADVIDATRNEGERRINFWRSELGITSQTDRAEHVHPLRHMP